MRRTLTTLACTAVLLLAAGCGGSDPDAKVAREKPAGQAYTLTLGTSSKPGKGGMMYVEGAVQRFRLTDTAGETIEPDPVSGSEAPAYSGLADGTYTLHAGQRPCDGNCGYLDPITDTCERQLTLASDLTVHVAFTVASPCRISLR
jgi:hypothetical protein